MKKISERMVHRYSTPNKHRYDSLARKPRIGNLYITRDGEEAPRHIRVTVEVDE